MIAHVAFHHRYGDSMTHLGRYSNSIYRTNLTYIFHYNDTCIYTYIYIAEIRGDFYNYLIFH